MELHEAVEKLVGPISPVGETNADDQRFENLREMTNLINHLLDQVRLVAEKKERHEFSIRRAGKYAEEFIVATVSVLRR